MRMTDGRHVAYLNEIRNTCRILFKETQRNIPFWRLNVDGIGSRKQSPTEKLFASGIGMEQFHPDPASKQSA
jgi:hypothetical protein